LVPLIVAQKDIGPAIERMSPQQRAAVIMALLALTLIGLFLIGFVMIGGHWVRRLARHRPRRGRPQTTGADQHALNEELPEIPGDEKTDDTVLLNRKSKDTIADNSQ
jgi:hypothetical protein